MQHSGIGFQAHRRVARWARGIRLHFAGMRMSKAEAVVAFVLLVLVIVFVWFQFPTVRSGPGSDYQFCPAYLGYIKRALDAYRKENGRYPPPHLFDTSGKPAHSWRVLLLPWLDFEQAYKLYDLDTPWNSPKNDAIFRGFVPFCYRCSTAKTRPPARETNYLAITGPGTAFGDGREGEKPGSLIPPDAILIVEVRSSGIPWMAPGDFDVRTMPKTISAPDGKGASSAHNGGFHVLFADGAIWFFSDATPFETLEKLFTMESARRLSKDVLLRPYATVRRDP